MYAKVFTSIWDGSLYGQLEGSAVLMMAVTLCNADGVLDMTPEAMAGRTGWPIDFIKRGIEQLERPDPRSRTPDDEGRRLVRIDDHRDWGWLIVNYKKYREMKDLDTIREQNRSRVAKFRASKKHVTLCNADVTHVTLRHAPSRQEEAEAEAEKDISVESADSTAKVFDHWRSAWNHPNAKLDAKRSRVIRDALKLYAADTLCAAISGYLKSPHHTGHNDRKTVYDDIGLLLRDAKHIEAGLEFAKSESKGAIQWR